MPSFPMDTHILHAQIPTGDILQLVRDTNVFLPVDNVEQLDRNWSRYRRISTIPVTAGVDRFIHVDFHDVDGPPGSYNLSDHTSVALVQTDLNGPVAFAPGVVVLAAEVRAGEILRLDTNVFVPVDEIEYRDHQWSRFRLSETFHLQSANGVDTFTVDFADSGVESKSYPAIEPLSVMMATWPTGKVLGGLMQ